jgi:hypothetical protein
MMLSPGDCKKLMPVALPLTALEATNSNWPAALVLSAQR